MDTCLDVYWKALDRIVRNCPVNVQKGGKITNDLVSLEAGRKKGSIKKSRPQFLDLIAAIDKFSAQQNENLHKSKNLLKTSKDETKAIREQLDAALGRELSLLLELMELKLKLHAITGEKIVPIRGGTKTI